MKFRKDSEVADWALDGAKPLGRPLQTWEREALRRKRRSLMRAATEMESMAMSGTASPGMAKVREETARKYRDQIAELEKVMTRFKILEGRKMKVSKRQLKRIIREERAKLESKIPLPIPKTMGSMGEAEEEEVEEGGLASATAAALTDSDEEELEESRLRRRRRVTKRQLRRIIREDAGALDSARAELEFALDEFIEANVLAGVTDAQAVRYDAMGILDNLMSDHWAKTGDPDLSRYRG